MRMMNGEKTSLALMKSRDERLSKDERLALRFNYLDLSFPQLTSRSLLAERSFYARTGPEFSAVLRF